MHPKCIKGDYEYHLTAFDRAMEGGIDDVGGEFYLDFQTLSLKFWL
jgi:hypothetical protein